MHKIMMFAAVVALSACAKKEAAPPPTEEINVAASETTAPPAATPAAVSTAQTLNGTTWTYTENGKNIEESIDDKGNYISTAGTAHEDHGTMVMKDGKACFTSAMTKDGESCWTVADVAIGASMDTVSDKGEKLKVTRVAYVAKTM